MPAVRFVCPTYSVVLSLVISVFLTACSEKSVEDDASPTPKTRVAFDSELALGQVVELNLPITRLQVNVLEIRRREVRSSAEVPTIDCFRFASS